MANLFVAANSVIGSAGHMQIVYDDRTGLLKESEVQAPEYAGLSGANWLMDQ